MLATRGQAPTSVAPTSFITLVNTIRQLRGESTFAYLDYAKAIPTRVPS